MSDAAPPSWIKRAPGLSAAHKFMLMVLWGWGPYQRLGPKDGDGDRQPSEPVRPYPSRELLAEVTDQPEATVKNQLRKLAAAGWIRRESGSIVTLAWRVPHAFYYGDRAIQGPRGCKDAPGHTRPEGVQGCTRPGHECTPGRATSAPLSSSDLPIHLPVILGDARARPTPQPDPTDRDPHDTRTAQSPPPDVEPSGDSAAPRPRAEGGRVTRREGEATSASGAGGSDRVRAGADSTRADNPHLAAAGPEHERLAAQRLARIRDANHRDFKPRDGGGLSQELWAVIEELGWEQDARSATWCTRLLEALGGYRVKPGAQGPWLRRVLEAYDAAGSDRPRADALWDYAGRKWLASVVQTPSRGGMSGALTAVASPDGYVPLAVARARAAAAAAKGAA